MKIWRVNVGSQEEFEETVVKDIVYSLESPARNGYQREIDEMKAKDYKPYAWWISLQVGVPDGMGEFNWEFVDQYDNYNYEDEQANKATS